MTGTCHFYDSSVNKKERGTPALQLFPVFTNK